jgi:hypothetical protein
VKIPRLARHIGNISDIIANVEYGNEPMGDCRPSVEHGRQSDGLIITIQPGDAIHQGPSLELEVIDAVFRDDVELGVIHQADETGDSDLLLSST